jgi:DNA-binding MarR family transcriptional regulator
VPSCLDPCVETTIGLQRALHDSAAGAPGLCATIVDVTDVVDDSGTGLAEAVEPRISYVVARLERAVRAAVNERVRPHGLTTLQYTTLSVLGARGQPLSNAQLARRAYMTPQSMIEVIDALERKGLIRRDPHPSHRRVFPATMTAKGRRVLKACDAAVEEMEEEMLAGLGIDERESLLVGLKSCVRALHAGFPE